MANAAGPATPTTRTTPLPPSLPSASGGVLSVHLLEARNLPALPGSGHQTASSTSSVGGSWKAGEPLSGAELTTDDDAGSALPYVILTFDKNEVVDARSPGSSFGGAAPPAHRRAQSISSNDVHLASAAFEGVWEKGRVLEEWVRSSSGSGEFLVQVTFEPAKSSSLTIDDFELLKVIGKGSFGKVMQVRKKDTGRIYAMKTIRKAHIVSRSEVTHTLAERTVLAQVRSAFIVPLKFCFQSRDKLYLVLSYVNGGELFHHLQKEGRFSEDRTRFYACELLTALDCLHQMDVVYRDLKPENILLDCTGHLVLCDFGLTKLNMGEDERTNTFAGTPEYLSPEVITGGGYTRTVDWWTLGVLVYEMLSGLPPFYEEDHQKMYRRIVSEPLSFPRGNLIRPSAKDFLTSLLDKSPSTRLGRGGADEIRRHLWFHDIDWKRLERRGYTPPWLPEVEGVEDTGNVDDTFLSEPVADSVVDPSQLAVVSESAQEQFAGFSYTAQLGPMGESVRY
ncbi:hypothetical protein JCM8097_000431 [Rhodosporidiobolus ruineniae]